MYLKLNKSKKDTLATIYENWYPFLGGILFVLVFNIVRKDIIDPPVDNLLNSVISFASVSIGFSGVLATLFFAQAKTDIVKTILKHTTYKKALERYFIRNCQAGFGIIIISLVVYIRTSIVRTNSIAIVWFLIKNIWVFILGYFLLASYRVISLIIRILFLSLDNVSKPDDETALTLSEDERQELRDKYSD